MPDIRGGIDYQEIADIASRVLQVSEEMPSVIALRFDDGTLGQYIFALPILDRYGFKATFGPHCSAIGMAGNMNIDQVRDLARRGHEIASHSWTHANLIDIFPLAADAPGGTTVLTVGLDPMLIVGDISPGFKVLIHIFDNANPIGELAEVITVDRTARRVILERGITGGYTVAQNARVAIGTHSSSLDRQLRDSQDWLQGNLTGSSFFQAKVMGFLLPMGNYSDLVTYRTAFFYNYYSTAWQVGNRRRLLPELRFLIDGGMAGEIPVDSSNVEVTKRLITNLSGTKGLFGSIFFHFVAETPGPGGVTTVKEFEEIIKLIYDLDLPVVTLSQAYYLALSWGAKLVKIVYLGRVGAGSFSGIADCVPILLDGFNYLSLTVEGIYHGLATRGARLHLHTSADEINWDTEPIETISLTFGAGRTVRETFAPSNTAQRAKYLRCIIQNMDTTHAITNIKVTATLGK